VSSSSMRTSRGNACPDWSSVKGFISSIVMSRSRYSCREQVKQGASVGYEQHYGHISCSCTLMDSFIPA
jgi:hypothetical protein